jgi:hypothetical protein
MTLIQSPAVVADPDKGIVGSGPVTRWTGSLEAYIDEDIADVVKGTQRVQVSGSGSLSNETIIDLPVNLPVWPNLEDLVTIVRTGVLARFAAAGPQSEVLIVRKIDGGLTMLGKLRLYVVRS